MESAPNFRHPGRRSIYDADDTSYRVRSYGIYMLRPTSSSVGREYLFSEAGYAGINVGATTGFWVMWMLKCNYQLRRLIRGLNGRRIATTPNSCANMMAEPVCRPLRSCPRIGRTNPCVE